MASNSKSSLEEPISVAHARAAKLSQEHQAASAALVEELVFKQ